MPYGVINLTPPGPPLSAQQFQYDGSIATITPGLTAKKVTASGKVLLLYDQGDGNTPKGYRWEQGSYETINQNPPWEIPFTETYDSSGTGDGPWLPVPYFYISWSGSTISDMNDSGAVIGSVSSGMSVDPVFQQLYTFLSKNGGNTSSIFTTPAVWPEGNNSIALQMAFPLGSTLVPELSGVIASSGTNTLAQIATDDGSAFGTFYSAEAFNFQYAYYTQVSSASELKWTNNFSVAAIAAPPGPALPPPNTLSALIQAVSPGGVHVIANFNSKVVGGVQNYDTFDGTPLTQAPGGNYAGVNDGGRYVNGTSWADGLGVRQSIVGLAPSGTALAINGNNDILGQKSNGAFALYTWTPPIPATETQPLIPGFYTEGLISFAGPPGWNMTSLANSINDSRLMVGQIQQFSDAAGNALPPAQQTVAPALFVPSALLVDANRDGFIDNNDVGATSPSHPFQFWINDNIDRLHTVDEWILSSGYQVQDSIGPEEATANQWDPDWINDTINCTRDLEDHARLWLYVGGLQTAIASGNIAIGLKWTPFSKAALSTDSSGTNFPSIKLFPAVEPDGGSLYLTDSNAAAAQVSGNYANAIINQDPSIISDITLVQPSSKDWDFILPPSALPNLASGSSPWAFFLFEGCTRGQGELTVVFLQQKGNYYTKIGNGPGIYLDLRNIKELYERWTIDDDPINFDGLSSSVYLGSNDTASDAGVIQVGTNGLPTISTQRLPAGTTGAQWTSPSSDLSAAGYILYVHGWNMQPWEKDAYAETAFKRLYWQGYKGRFGTFQWPTTVIEAPYDNAVKAYDNGEYAAWLSAGSLEDLLVQLNSIYGNNVYVFAHSMGNVVAGEAFRLAAADGAGQLVAGYVASQAAITGSSWDSSLTTSAPLNFPVLTGPDTPNIYNNWMNNGSGVTNPVAALKYNFDNVNDYALSKWAIDQVSKPDIFVTALLDKVYYYGSSNLNQNPVPDLFERAPCTTLATGELAITDHTAVIPTALHLASANGINDQYEIMAYDAESRGLALGAISTSVNGFLSTSLGPDPSNGLSVIWPTDPLGASLKPTSNYSEHPWHSAEFRFDNPSQDRYWNELMKKFSQTPNHNSSP